MSEIKLLHRVMKISFAIVVVQWNNDDSTVSNTNTTKEDMEAC